MVVYSELLTPTSFSRLRCEHKPFENLIEVTPPDGHNGAIGYRNKMELA